MDDPQYNCHELGVNGALVSEFSVGDVIAHLQNRLARDAHSEQL